MTPPHPAKATTPAEVFRPARDHILAIVLLTVIASLSIAWAPKYLAWILIFPLLGIWWVLRSSTRVSEAGITATYAFRPARSTSWEDLSGVGFQGARAFARTTAGEKFTLPGVTFNSLPRLAEASRGRIPDALTAGQEAADAKVVIVHRDGQQVLLSQEEYARYVENHPELEK